MEASPLPLQNSDPVLKHSTCITGNAEKRTALSSIPLPQPALKNPPPGHPPLWHPPLHHPKVFPLSHETLLDLPLWHPHPPTLRKPTFPKCSVRTESCSPKRRS